MTLMCIPEASLSILFRGLWFLNVLVLWWTSTTLSSAGRTALILDQVPRPIFGTRTGSRARRELEQRRWRTKRRSKRILRLDTHRICCVSKLRRSCSCPDGERTVWLVELLQKAFCEWTHKRRTELSDVCQLKIRGRTIISMLLKCSCYIRSAPFGRASSSEGARSFRESLEKMILARFYTYNYVQNIVLENF